MISGVQRDSEPKEPLRPLKNGLRLRVQGVHFTYQGTRSPALQGIDLELAQRCCPGLIGPNGAGKSTLLRLSAGLIRPSSGDVMIGGESTSALKPSALGQLLAYVPQSFSLPFTYQVLEVVLQGRHPHLGGVTFEGRRDLEIARAAMERTGVWHLRDRHFDALSGGERQRVVIATALAQEPTLLLLDEPTSSLDLRFQAELVRLLRELVEERELAVLVALHDLNLASALCDELLLLVDGQVKARGKPEEVLLQNILEDAYETRLVIGRGPQGIYVLPSTSA